MTEFGDTARSGWFIGTGRAMMTRANLFRESNGVAVQMLNRVFDLPPFHGATSEPFFISFLCMSIHHVLCNSFASALSLCQRQCVKNLQLTADIWFVSVRFAER